MSANELIVADAARGHAAQSTRTSHHTRGSHRECDEILEIYTMREAPVTHAIRRRTRACWRNRGPFPILWTRRATGGWGHRHAATKGPGASSDNRRRSRGSRAGHASSSRSSSPLAAHTAPRVAQPRSIRLQLRSSSTPTRLPCKHPDRRHRQRPRRPARPRINSDVSTVWKLAFLKERTPPPPRLTVNYSALCCEQSLLIP